MAESDLHKHIKYSIAKGLVELGYQSGVEVPTRDGGYIKMYKVEEETLITL